MDNSTKGMNPLEFMQYIAELGCEKDPFGYKGRAYEMATRYSLSGKKPAHCKGTFDQYGDHRKRVADGHYAAVEVKTACGELIFQSKTEYIIYCPEVDLTVDPDLQGYVFTIDQWNAFINGYTGRGSFLRIDSKGIPHIQSFRSEGRPKASKTIRDYIDATLASLPTVREWKEACKA